MEVRLILKSILPKETKFLLFIIEKNLYCYINQGIRQKNNTVEAFITKEEQRTHKSTYKKLAVQWLNGALCFVSNSVMADSFRLRNRQLLVAAQR